MRRLQAVLRRDAANPAWLCLVAGSPNEMYIELFGLFNITRPEETYVAILVTVAARDAFKCHLYHAIIEQFVAHAAFQSPVRRWWLVELSRVSVDDAQLHQRISRLEKHAILLYGSVVYMLEVQAGERWNEKVARLPLVFERSQPVITGAMIRQHFIIHCAVVCHNRFDRAAPEHDVRLVGNSVANVFMGKRRARLWFWQSRRTEHCTHQDQAYTCRPKSHLSTPLLNLKYSRLARCQRDIATGRQCFVPPQIFDRPRGGGQR